MQYLLSTTQNVKRYNYCLFCKTVFCSLSIWHHDFSVCFNALIPLFFFFLSKKAFRLMAKKKQTAKRNAGLW